MVNVKTLKVNGEYYNYVTTLVDPLGEVVGYRYRGLTRDSIMIDNMVRLGENFEIVETY